MAILPIDLQTLYTQMDKVGKSVLSQQAAMQQAKAVSDADVRKTAEAKAKTVQGPETENEFTAKVSDRNGSAHDAEERQKGKQETDAGNQEDGVQENTDGKNSDLLASGVGNKIDISI